MYERLRQFNIESFRPKCLSWLPTDRRTESQQIRELYVGVGYRSAHLFYGHGTGRVNSGEPIYGNRNGGGRSPKA